MILGYLCIIRLMCHNKLEDHMFGYDCTNLEQNEI